VQVAQLASNPVCETAVVEAVAVPEPVTHEAQSWFVESKAYPAGHWTQVISLVVSTSHHSQSATNPVYVNDAEFTPVWQLTQTLFVVSHS